MYFIARCIIGLIGLCKLSFSLIKLAILMCWIFYQYSSHSAFYGEGAIKTEKGELPQYQTVAKALKCLILVPLIMNSQTLKTLTVSNSSKGFVDDLFVSGWFCSMIGIS